MCLPCSAHDTSEAPIDDRHIIRSIEDAARSLGEPVDVELAMHEVADVARGSVPAFDHASVTLLLPGGRFETEASTGPLPRELDAAQYAAGEGPCLDAVRHGELTSVPHLRSERRWPAYVSAAVALGVRSHLSVRLRVGAKGTSAGLNLYSTTADEISLESKAMALLFGLHSLDGPDPAATPPGRARRRTRSTASAKPSASSWTEWASTRLGRSTTSTRPPPAPTCH